MKRGLTRRLKIVKGPKPDFHPLPVLVVRFE